MKQRWTVSFVTLGLAVVGFGQQTPPVQPKTVDTPKLPELILPGPPKPDVQVANAPLTADEAVRIALAHQPQITISKAAADTLRGQRIQAQSALNPTVTISAGGTRTQSLNGGNGSSGVAVGPLTEYTSEIAANQLIFDFNRTRDQVRQAQALESAGYRTYDQTLQDVALQVKEDYYAYVQAKAQVDVDVANVKNRQAQVDLTQAQVNAGIGEPVDLVSAKTLLDQGQLQLVQANQALITASVTLAQEMGIDPRTPLNIQTSHESSSGFGDMNAMVDMALKQRPEILSAEESLRAAGYGVSVARKTDAPSLNLSGGVVSGGQNDIFGSQTSFISLTLTWDLIDGGLQHGRVISAQAQKNSAAATLLQTSQSVVSDVSKAYIAVKAAQNQIPIANAEVANAQEGIRLAEGSYRAGVAVFQTVITAQANLVTAQTDQVNAVAALDTALATLEHAIGKSLAR